ncbi:MAG: hypothetical protein ACXWXO_12720 [Nocardioides sp.]
MTESILTTAGPPATTPMPPVPDDWVPADERVAGFDRRTIWPGVVLLVVWALWAHVMPWVDEQIEVDNPVVAGDVVNLGLGQVTFVPAAGWNLESGALLTEGAEEATPVPSSVVLSSEVVSYGARSGNWDGTTEELADRMIDVNESLEQLLAKDEQGRSAIENVDGVPGELVYVAGADQAVLIATFVFERDGTDIGVEIEARGTPAALEEQVEDIATMIETTTYRPEGQEATS